MRRTSKTLYSATIVFASLVLLILPTLALAQADLSGEWEGFINIPGQKLGIILKFAVEENGKTSGVIDIPAQGAFGLPLSSITVDAAEISFEMPGNASFQGTASEDGAAITGQFMQAGMTFPFEVSRKTAAAQAEQVTEEEITTPEGLENFGDYVTTVLEDWKVPGAAVAVVKDGQIVFAEGFGVRDLETKEPVTINTQFGIGSTTKAFTATLIGMLVDEGKLNWDVPFRDYVPTFSVDDNVIAENVTLRDLASHRAGLPRHDLLWVFNPEITRAEVIKQSKYLKPNAGFRQTFQYSNFGYVLAGHLLEQISNDSWENQVTSRILQPLGMNNTNLTIPEMQKTGNYALPYADRGNGVEQVDFWHVGAAAPAGAINSDIMDMARWVKFQLAMGNTGEEQLVSQGTILQTQSPQFVIAGRIGMPEIAHLSYGLGWMTQSYRGHYYVLHDGVTVGYSVSVAMLPDKNTGVVVLSNLHGNPVPQLIAYTAFDRLLGLEEIDWNGIVKSSMAAQADMVASLSTLDKRSRVEGTTPIHKLEEYVGAYNHPLYGTIGVTLQDGALGMRYYNTEFELEHWHYDVFIASVNKFGPIESAAQFVTDINGKVAELKLGLDPMASTDLVTFTRMAEAAVTDEAFLQQMTGDYDVLGTPITVVYKNGSLQMLIPGQPPSHLESAGGTKFVLLNAPGFSVDFTIDPELGLATEITLIQPNGNFSGNRK